MTLQEHKAPAAADARGAPVGLNQTEAAQRLAADGPNALPGGQRRTLLSIAGETVREPMFLLLLAAGTLYLVFGDLQEGLTLFGFVLVTLGLTLYQEGKTERAIEALRDLTSPRALVIRDGRPQRCTCPGPSACCVSRRCRRMNWRRPARWACWACCGSRVSNGHAVGVAMPRTERGVRMCGLCGELRLDGSLPDIGALGRMSDKLARRDPRRGDRPAQGRLPGAGLETRARAVSRTDARHPAAEACIRCGLYQRDDVEQLLADPEARFSRIRGSKLWHLAVPEWWLQANVNSVTDHV